MSTELTNCIKEIEALISERASIQESIKKHTDTLSQDISSSERERLAGEIGKLEARIKEISLSLEGLEQRKTQIENAIKEAKNKDNKLQIHKIELALIYAYKRKLSLIKDTLFVQDEIVSLVNQRTEKLGNEKMSIPGLDNVDLNYLSLIVGPIVDKNNINSSMFAELQKAFAIAEDATNKAIKELA